MNEPGHDHAWETSPLLCYLKTDWDGPNYRTLVLQVCGDCGVLRLEPSVAARVAGHQTWDSVPRAAEAPKEKATDG